MVWRTSSGTKIHQAVRIQGNGESKCLTAWTVLMWAAGLQGNNYPKSRWSSPHQSHSKQSVCHEQTHKDKQRQCSSISSPAGWPTAIPQLRDEHCAPTRSKPRVSTGSLFIQTSFPCQYVQGFSRQKAVAETSYSHLNLSNLAWS